MATRRRIAAWLIVVAGCLLAAVVFLAPVFFHPDRYRPEAISYFEENTGRKVEIERLALTFFPKVTVHIDGFGVKSPPLFPPSYIVKVGRADAVLDFWALLHRQVVIRSLVLEDPESASNLLPSDAAGPVFFEAHDVSRDEKYAEHIPFSEWSREWKSSGGTEINLVSDRLS